ncbi:MAG: hypothetical protein ACTSPA_15045 [Promethearchaeota archaeon]
MVKSEKQIKWNFLDVDEFTIKHLQDFNVKDLTKMFLREEDPMVPELAYLAFLLKSKWGVSFDIERGIKRTLMQLRLPLFEGQGLSWTEKKMNPAKIWASEDSLDYDTFEMVEVAFKYMIKTQKPIPPVVVWLIKTESRYNLVCHDGHHRISVANKLKMKIPAIVLEYWIDNRENPLLPQKIPYRKINTYTIDLPVEKFEPI